MSFIRVMLQRYIGEGVREEGEGVLVRNNGVRNYIEIFGHCHSARFWEAERNGERVFCHLFINLLKMQLPLPVQSLICGGAAATSLWLVAYPTDVVKNNIFSLLPPVSSLLLPSLPPSRSSHSSSSTPQKDDGAR
jgi:hypothetical protein